MLAKVILAFCAQALMVQGIFTQCISGPGFIDDFARNQFLASPYGPAAGYQPAYPTCVAPASGGGFLVQSSSPITPTGVSVFSENAIEGALSVIGELPFLGAVVLEGTLPTAGAGGIDYSCGDGVVAIVSEGVGYPGSVPYNGGVGYAPNACNGYPNVGYGMY